MFYHKVTISKQWLKNRSIRLNFKPSQNPNLNLTKNIWSYIKSKQTRVNFSSIDQRFEAINCEWKNIHLSLCEKLSASLTVSLKQLKKSKENIL